MYNYTRVTLQKLEQILKTFDYVVRYEKGNFSSGYCIVENTKVVVINRFFDTDGRVNTILDILQTIDFPENILDEKQKVFYRNILKQRYSTTQPETHG